VTKALIRSLRFMRAYRGVATAAVLAVLAGSVTDLAAPQILRWVIDSGIARGDMGVVSRGAAMLVAVAALGAGAQFLQGYLSAKASHGAAFDMRNEIFARLQDLSFSYHDRAQTGNLITRVTSDVDLVRDFVGGGLVNAISAVLMLTGAVVLLLLMNWRLAIVSLIAIPATLWVLFSFVGKLGPQSRLFQERLSALNSVLQENIAGIRVVKAFAREEFEAGRYDEASQALLQQGLVQRAIVGSLGLVAVTWVGAYQIVAGTLSVGGLVAFTAYIALLLQPLFVIGFGAQAVARAGASAQRLFEVLDAESEVAERADAVELPSLAGRVEFEAVSLRYPGDDHDTLADVSFVAKPDTTVAIVGATGSGKTSIVNLIPRFYDVTSGAVRVDGHDVRGVTLDSLRAQIGVVMQDSVLFSGTVRDNIAYGRSSATPAEVTAAAVAAQADAFISEMKASASPEASASGSQSRGPCSSSRGS
jgi:ATP-binding cassette subfamily B multidrug efflux pump